MVVIEAATNSAGASSAVAKHTALVLPLADELLNVGVLKDRCDITATASCSADRGLVCDERTDVWATCVSLYETITGRAPFVGQDIAATARNVFETPLAFPTDVPALDGKLWAILTHGLRKDPVDRIPNACDLRADLAAWLAREARPRASLPQPHPRHPRHPQRTGALTIRRPDPEGVHQGVTFARVHRTTRHG
jgi:hypothetical protein